MYKTIGDAGVDGLIINGQPVASTTPSGLPAWGPRPARGTDTRAYTRRLMRRQNDEAQTFVDQDFHHCIVAGSFRKPHCFRLTSEAMAKISHAPTNLRPQVARIAQGQDRMSIGLSNSVAMSTAFQGTFAIRLNDARVCVRVITFKPTQKRRSEIETEVRVIIDDSLFNGRRTHDAHESVWPVALRMNPLIPIMERRGTGFSINNPGPGILARWLIEMTVDDQFRHESMKA